MVKHPHYVPIGAMLRNFAAMEDTIWMYQRGGKPVLQAIQNVGKQRFLYDQETEEGFMDLDGRAVSVMAMLNSLESSRELSPETWAVVLLFVGFQAMRTPRAQDRLKEIDQRLLRKMGDSTDVIKAVEAIVADKNWWLGRMGRLGRLAARVLEAKTMTVFRNNTAAPFLLSDDPVLLVRNGGYPATERQGLFHAHIIFPVGSRAALFLRLPEILWPRNEQKHRTVQVREADAPLVDLVNIALMTRAGRFLFARENSPSIAQAFDRSRLDKSLEPLAITGLSGPPAGFPSV